VETYTSQFHARKTALARWADTIAVLDSGYTKAAKTNNARAQQRRSMEIVELKGKRKSKVGTNDCVLSVAAIYRITGKRWGIAEILHTEVTIPASAVGSSHPGNAYTRADRRVLHGSGAGSSRYDIADDLMSGNDSGTTRR